MARETWVQSQVESYQRLKKLYLIPPRLTLSIIRYGSSVMCFYSCFWNLHYLTCQRSNFNTCVRSNLVRSQINLYTLVVLEAKNARWIKKRIGDSLLWSKQLTCTDKYISYILEKISSLFRQVVQFTKKDNRFMRRSILITKLSKLKIISKTKTKKKPRFWEKKMMGNKLKSIVIHFQSYFF